MGLFSRGKRPELTKTTQDIRKALKHRNPSVRKQAANAVKQFFNSEISSDLRSLILSDTMEVAEEAIATLLAVGDFQNLFWTLVEATGEGWRRIGSDAFKGLGFQGRQSGSEGIELFGRCLRMLVNQDIRSSVDSLYSVLKEWAEAAEMFAPYTGYGIMRPPGGWGLAELELAHYLYIVRAESPVKDVIRLAAEACGHLMKTETVIKICEEMRDIESPSFRITRWIVIFSLPHLTSEGNIRAVSTLCRNLYRVSLSLPLFDWETRIIDGVFRSPYAGEIAKAGLNQENGPDVWGWMAADKPTLCSVLNQLKLDSNDPLVRSNAERALQQAEKERSLRKEQRSY